MNILFQIASIREVGSAMMVGVTLAAEVVMDFLNARGKRMKLIVVSLHYIVFDIKVNCFHGYSS